VAKHNVATYATGGLITYPQLTNSTATTWTATSTDARIWQNWITVGSTTSSTITWQQPVWDAWLRDERVYHEARALTRQQADELQVRREQRSREALAAEQARMENRVVAHARALDLLDELLTEDEREVRDSQQRVAVRGSDGHLYWLEMHRETVHGNIVRTDEHGCQLGRACVAPQMRDGYDVLPTADGWVGQYLGLKFDAVAFLSHANWSGVQRCRVGRAAA
jgi:hypothetical protein